MENTSKIQRKQALLPILQVHVALRQPRPELDGDDVAFLLAVAGWLGYGKKPTVVGKYEFRVALSTIQEFLRTGKGKVVASRKKLLQLGIIEETRPCERGDHVPATYRIHVNLIGSEVPGQNADTCMARFHSETSRGSDVEPGEVPGQNLARFRRETVRSSLESAEHEDLDPLVVATLHTNATIATASASTVTTAQIRDLILSDPDLARITPVEVVNTIASEYAAAPVDFVATIRSAGDYLRIDKGKAIRDGANHLRRRLQWAIEKSKEPKKAQPSKAKTSYVVDFNEHPELLPKPRRGAKF